MRVEPDRLFTANAQEVERIQGGPGAVILLAERLPLPFEDTSSILRQSPTRERPTRWAASSRVTSCSGPVVVPEAVEDLLQKIDRLIAHTEHLDGFRQESHRKETLDVYREAREVLRRRLVAH